MRLRKGRQGHGVWRERRLDARLERTCSRWGITLRKAVGAGLLPIIAAMQQSVVARFVTAPACELLPGATPSGSVAAGQGTSKVVVTLASGMVVASHAIMVTATLCGPGDQLLSPGLVAIKVDVAGSLGRFTVITGWSGVRMAGPGEASPKAGR